MSNTLHALGQDASKLARERIFDPAKHLITDAKATLQNETHQASSIPKADLHQAQESLDRLHRKTERWIATHPFTSVGLALMAGLAMAAVSRSVRL